MIKALDKNGALEQVAKHLGMFVEKHEQDVSDPLAQLFREVQWRIVPVQGRRLNSGVLSSADNRNQLWAVLQASAAAWVATTN